MEKIKRQRTIFTLDVKGLSLNDLNDKIHFHLRDHGDKLVYPYSGSLIIYKVEEETDQEYNERIGSHIRELETSISRDIKSMEDLKSKLIKTSKPKPLTKKWRDSVKEFKSQGKFVDAIKLVREKTGKSLSDAKRYVEQMK